MNYDFITVFTAKKFTSLEKIYIAEQGLPCLQVCNKKSEIVRIILNSHSLQFSTGR